MESRTSARGRQFAVCLVLFEVLLLQFAMHRPWVVVVQCVLADGT